VITIGPMTHWRDVEAFLAGEPGSPEPIGEPGGSRGYVIDVSQATGTLTVSGTMDKKTKPKPRPRPKY
jgi:hypothetical protein